MIFPPREHFFEPIEVMTVTIARHHPAKNFS
jgi:hypothetical protein